ncbi:TolC family protein [Geomonas sp. Red32]|uniref:TolC family protein n=1 Tax=Geomonas sp. Red32 TaxID=2912856 RepID=UPI00202D054F|nr:TolC family protein [Geomonas sp. Red32]MCM0082206.1 TolC family protein [Geomonas sp. Red32]
MSRIFSLKGAAGFLFIGTLACANAGRAETIDVRRAAAMALSDNGELKALREERGVREAGETKASLYPNPVLEAGLDSGWLTGSPDESTFSVALSQQFVTMGKREKRRAVARKELVSFDRQLDNSGRLLGEEVKVTFYDIILAKRRTELAGRSLVLANQLLDVARERFAAGDIPELEVNLARVEVARNEERKNETERELVPARSRLLYLMGRSPSDGIELLDDLEENPPPLEPAALKGRALASRPDLKAAAAEQGKGEAGIELARAERIPDLTAGIGYQRQNSSFEIGGVTGKQHDNLVALTLSVPLPFFDKNQAALREAQAHKGSAEARSRYLQAGIEREVDASLARLAAAEKSVAIYRKEILPQLEENLKLVQEAYRLGETGILAVIEEQRKFFEVNDGYLTALYGQRVAFAKLEAAVGEELEKGTTGGGK